MDLGLQSRASSETGSIACEYTIGTLSFHKGDVFCSTYSHPYRKPLDSGLCRDLECSICLEMPDIIKTESDSEHIFSCQQHHIICEGCLRLNIPDCPTCHQDFRQQQPQRNYLAERLIRQHLEFLMKKNTSDSFEIPIQGKVFINS